MKMITVIKFHARHFHVTSKCFLRRRALKPSLNIEEPEYLCNNFDSSIHQSSSTDYLGIESDDGVIIVKPQKHPLPEIVQQPKKAKEKFYTTSFGVVRYDVDNKLKFHGQYGRNDELSFPRNSSDNFEVRKSLQNFSKNRLSKKRSLGQDLKAFPVSKMKNTNCELNLSEKEDKDVNYIDAYYFSSSIDASCIPKNAKLVANKELNSLKKDNFETVNTPEFFSDEQKISSRSLSSKKEGAMFNENNKPVTTDNNKIENSSAKFDLCEKKDTYGSYIDDHYFGDKIENSDAEFDIGEKKDTYGSYIDDHYFGDKIENSDKETSQHNTSNISKLNDIQVSNEYMKSDDLLNDDSLFQSNPYGQHNSQNRTEHNVDYLQNNELSISSSDILNKKTQKEDSQNNENTQAALKHNSISNKTMPSHIINSKISNVKYVKPAKENFRFSSPTSQSPDEDGAPEITAHDFVTDLRKKHQNIKTEKGEKFDSKGFRILKNQVEDLSHFTKDEILKILKQNVVYSDDDLLVLNKPYSLVIHESQTTKYPCLSMFLNDLAKEMDQQGTNPQLFTVHRLDKETTGCLLLARNEIMAQNLKSLFAQRKIIKKYWIITAGVPDPTEGVINIPIAEGSIDNRKRMVLHPILPKHIPYKSHSRHGKPAITSYKVISQSGNAALIEATPVTGIKHQIRVHFGLGLSCPILGDHKYSYLDKLVPQKLPSDMLQRLKVRQSKVRHIPMHIHAKSITIPQYFEGRNLYVNVPLPDHMKVNLKRLKFRS